jgi:hypothetical protein
MSTEERLERTQISREFGSASFGPRLTGSDHDATPVTCFGNSDGNNTPIVTLVRSNERSNNAQSVAISAGSPNRLSFRPALRLGGSETQEWLRFVRVSRLTKTSIRLITPALPRSIEQERPRGSRSSLAHQSSNGRGSFSLNRAAFKTSQNCSRDSEAAQSRRGTPRARRRSRPPMPRRIVYTLSSSNSSWTR